jgi:hypothetical protein
VALPFRQADESRNWRFRRLIARQLTALPALFHCDDVDAFMSQQALSLAQDPIAFVAQPAHEAVSTFVYSIHLVLVACTVVICAFVLLI